MKFAVRIDSERCKGCELCISVCPEKVLAMCGKLNARGQHFPEVVKAEACTGCARCAVICPDTAIRIDAEEDDR
ncbi:MAG: 4Fe-4S dicluster domain-containing protein [Lentisphaerae bacterium]|nr:4Fe-4S dicluster domain-containing protein [Lentisphaerota bacterium]